MKSSEMYIPAPAAVIAASQTALLDEGRKLSSVIAMKA